MQNPPPPPQKSNGPSLSIQAKKTPHVKYAKYRKVNPKSIEKMSNDISQADIISQIDANEFGNSNENYVRMNSIIQQAFEKHMPLKCIKFNKHKHKMSPWITTGIIRSICFRDKLYIRLHKTEPDTELYNTLKTNLATYKCILKKSIRIAKQNYYESCFEKYKNNIRKTWQTISDILNRHKNKRSFPEYFMEDGSQITDKLEVANKFNAYFTQIGPKLANSITTPKNQSFRNYLTKKHKCTFEFKDINNDTVTKVIDSLKPKSSHGHDGLSVSLMKQVKDVIVEPLKIIINQMLKTGIFPNPLKIARVIPIFKKGDEHIFTNYRPISLLPAISKVFEVVIYLQLYEYLKTNNLIYDSQYGFRPEHSTELSTLELVDRLLQDMDTDKVPINIYIDLSKAFDTIDHNILLEKLEYYGVKSIELKVFQSYLQNRKQYVDIDNICSDILPINTGVPQGSILGPLLFLIYVNDIDNASTLFKALIYADDTTLSSTLCAFDTKDKIPSGDIINL